MPGSERQQSLGPDVLLGIQRHPEFTVMLTSLCQDGVNSVLWLVLGP